MDQSTPPKRKPGRPRKAKPAAGIQNTQTPESNPSEANPLEATIKAARSAYEPRNQSRSPIVPRGTQGTDKGEVTAKGVDRLGAATLPPLPLPRTRGRLETPSQYVNLIPEPVVVAWATNYVTTRNSQRLLADLQPGIGRENQRWRSDLVHELERLPLAIETMSQVRSELVMSDLQRRKLLRQIAETESHPMRGDSDRINAIKVDAELDPESTPNKLKQSKAEANSLTFNAPVSLFFMPSTQARAIQPAPEPKAIEVVAKDCTDIRYNDKDTAAIPLHPVGGTPGS